MFKIDFYGFVLLNPVGLISVEQIAINLGLKSLKSRPLFFETAVFLHKIINGDVDCTEFLQKIYLKVSTFNSRKTKPFFIHITKKYFFLIINQVIYLLIKIFFYHTCSELKINIFMAFD